MVKVEITVEFGGMEIGQQKVITEVVANNLVNRGLVKIIETVKPNLVTKVDSNKVVDVPKKVQVKIKKVK